MSAFMKCDACGQQAKMRVDERGVYRCPDGWYQRQTEGGSVIACCSQPCVMDFNVRVEQEKKWVVQGFGQETA